MYLIINYPEDSLKETLIEFLSIIKQAKLTYSLPKGKGFGCEQPQPVMRLIRLPSLSSPYTILTGQLSGKT